MIKYINKYIKIFTEFSDKDPKILIVSENKEYDLNEFLMFTNLKLVNIIPTPIINHFKRSILCVGVFCGEDINVEPNEDINVKPS